MALRAARLPSVDSGEDDARPRHEDTEAATNDDDDDDDAPDPLPPRGRGRRNRRQPAAVSRAGYALLLLQGVGMLFPFNAFITCTGFYDVAFAGTSYAAAVEPAIVFSYTALNLVGLGLGLVCDGPSRRARVLVPLLGQLALFVCACALTPAGALPPRALLAALLAMSCASSLLSAALQGGVLAFSSTLPPLYNNAVVAGQALSGLVVAGANWGLLGAQVLGGGGADPRAAALAYYAVAACVMGVCAASHSALEALHARGRLHAHTKLPLADLASAESEAGLPAVPAVPFDALPEPGAMDTAPSAADVAAAPPGGGGADSAGGGGAPAAAAAEDSASMPLAAEARRRRRRWSALARVRAELLTLFATFAVTLAVFPSASARVAPRGLWPGARPSRAYAQLFVPALFVLFNAGDLLGRALAARWALARARPLVLLALVRVVLVPAFFALPRAPAGGGGVPGAGAGGAGGAGGGTDWPALLAMATLSVTNGYCAAVAFMTAPARVPPAEQALVGHALPLALALGLAAGSLLALALEHALP